MTDDFKQTLFNYLIGKLPNEQGTTEEIFKSIDEIPRSKWANFLPNGGTWTAMRIEGLIAPSENTSNFTVLYGGYSIGTVEDEAFGFIYLLNNNFEPIKLFEEYDSGTKLRYIQQMQVASDGTFFAVDDVVYSYNNEQYVQTSQKRFIMLNNFTQQINDDYILTLQKSYIFPSNYFNFYCKYLTKNPNSSHYLLVGARANNIGNSLDFDAVGCIDLKINVGSENEWDFQSTPLNSNGEAVIFGGAIATFDSDDNLSFKIIGTGTSNSLNQPIYLYSQNYGETSWNRKTITSNGLYIDSIFFNNQCYFINDDVVYFVLSNEYWGNSGVIEEKYIGLYKYIISTNILEELFIENLGQADYIHTRGIYLSANNNELYVLYCKDDDEDEIGDFYYFRYKNKWDPKLIASQKPFRFRSEYFFVKSNFNLVSGFVTKTTFTETYWNQILVKENYNSSNYNGEPYINTNALIPNSAEIFSNESLVFARNLYNKTINNNTTVSTVEIPNTYLNGIDLTSKNLLSETNLTMVEDTNVTQKNIYETMFLNFINVLQVADRNNATQVLNQEASTYLNSAINTDNGYDNAKLYNKVIINYQDGSTKEVSYAHENTTETSTVIAFGLYIDKLISNAELVSNDKSMVYQTIDLSNLELNKNYSIKQKLEVV